MIANSHNSKNLLVGDWGVPEASVHVVHPGVDTDRFNPEVDGRALRGRVARDGDVLFMSVGRLQRRKGHDVTLRALAELTKTRANVRYVVVGDGPERTALAAQAEALGLGDIVTFAGPAIESELPAWYAAADVFVMPNRSDGVDFEGFGIVFLEAAAAGRPVVGGRSGGVPEAIEDGVTGLLVDGATRDDVRSAMEALADSAELRLRLGAAGRQRVLRQFTWDRAAARVSEIAP